MQLICRTEEPMYKSHSFILTLIIGLILFAGCGAPSSKAPHAEDSSYITIADAKTAVLENAGLSEENVVFVRLHLDSDGDTAKYDIEFVSETAEYTYTVNAVTGEILSLNYEAGHYDLADIQTGSTVPDTAQNDMPSDGVQSNGTPSGGSQPDNTQSGTAPSDAAPSGSFPSGSSDAGSQYIGRDAAQQTALTHAGFDADSVSIAHIHLEYDDGCWQYDVKFYKDNIEYDYDIDAITGAILSCHHDAEHDSYHHGKAPDSANLITEDTAKQLALEYAGVTEAESQNLKIKLEYDDGYAEYEVEWHVGRTEYSCDVDAYTGTILSFEKELD